MYRLVAFVEPAWQATETAECPPLGWVDVTLGLGQPAATSVELSLLTGENVAPKLGGHRHGRVDEPWRQYCVDHSVLRGRPLLWANAHRPDAFRGPPSTWALAAQAAGEAPRTLGLLRRGEALPGDVTGESLIRRGHRDVAPITVEEAAERVRRWQQAGRAVLWIIDRATPLETVKALFRALNAAHVAWTALGWPGRGVVTWPPALPAWGEPALEPPQDVTGWFATCWGRP